MKFFIKEEKTIRYKRGVRNAREGAQPEVYGYPGVSGGITGIPQTPYWVFSAPGERASPDDSPMYLEGIE